MTRRQIVLGRARDIAVILLLGVAAGVVVLLIEQRLLAMIAAAAVSYFISLRKLRTWFAFVLVLVAVDPSGFCWRPWIVDPTMALRLGPW